MRENLALYSPPTDEETADEGAPFRSNNATVRDVLTWYRDSSSRKIGSSIAERERRRLWILFCDHRPDPRSTATMGDRPTQTCRPFELLQWIDANLGRAGADNTRRRWNATIQRPFNLAARHGLIAKNPFHGLTFEEGETGRDWTDDEFQTVLRNAPPAFRRLIVALRFSGLRPAEGCDLAFPRIRVDAGRLVIDQHKTRRHTKRPRVVPTNTVLVKLFDWQRRHNPPGTTTAILNTRGRPWTRTYADAALRRLRQRVNARVERLKTSSRTPAPRFLVGLTDEVTLHGLRHAFATQALITGVPLASVAEILGHKSAAVTANVYAHVARHPEHLAREMEAAIHRPPKPRAAAKATRQPQPTPLFDAIR